MTELDVIALYGPGNLKAEDLVAGFVARETTLDYFLGELRQQTAANTSPRHHLIIGQRGMGKTTLLHRIAIAVGEHDDLEQALLPLTFREEQYNVINLHVFWRNAIEALLEWLEQNGHDQHAHNLERHLDDVENAYEQNRKDQAGGDVAWRVFKTACETLGKRPVLFLDNLDLILDALKKHDWGLRDILQQSGCPIVVGAAAAYPKSLSDRKAAFFDFFRLTTLARLESHEVRACLQRLAQKRGAAGTKVADLLRSDPGRINALTEMTGGNPRTLAVLYLLLESQAGEDAFADLEKLLDRMTPLYKARAEEAAPQARAVLDAVALNWDPITANSIAKVSGLEVTVVNAQLKRLENDGFLEKVPVSGSGRSGYQMVERFFNIWYLMRHGSRRLKQKVCWLTAFLRGFYTPGDREDLAIGFLRSGNHKGRADLMLALSESVDDLVVRKALSQAVGRDLLQQSATRKRIEQLVDLRDIAPELADMAELERKALTVQREWPEGWDAKRFWELLGGTLEMNAGEKQVIVEQLPEMDAEQLIELVATLRNEIVELCQQLELDEAVLLSYRAAIREGSVRHRYDVQGAAAIGLRDNDPNISALGCLLALDGKNFIDPEMLRDIQRRFDSQSSSLWKSVDWHLNKQKSCTAKDLVSYGRWLYLWGDTQEAVSVCRKATALDPNLAHAWNGLGVSLKIIGDYDQAEAAYHQSIGLDSSFLAPWHNLGNLYQDYLGRYEDAERAYRQAIAIDPSHPYPWNSLGALLKNWLDRYDEAEAAFREAIRLDSKFAAPRIQLAELLLDDSGRYEEAEKAFREAVALQPDNSYLWTCIGELLTKHLDKYEEAEKVFRKVISLEPQNPYPWFELGNLLQDHFDRYSEAEFAYRQAIALNAENSQYWQALGDLLQDKFGRYDQAEQAYLRTLELEIFPHRQDYIHALLASLYWFVLYRPDDARLHAELGRQVSESYIGYLLDAAQFLVEEKPGPAFNSIDGALAEEDHNFWLLYGKPVQRILRYAIDKGYGPKFLEFMQAAAYQDRYAPLYWAFLAALEGKDILLNVNPEVRRTAEKIYRGLVVKGNPASQAKRPRNR